ncbi:ty3-gypsy retrotransposon protein, partial [Tanacetum coccineum]
ISESISVSESLFRINVSCLSRDKIRICVGEAQLAALQADLQATKLLVQTRSGGGGDQVSTIPRAMRLDVPKFSGTDPDSDAAEWFWWMTRNKLISTWEVFVESMRNHFGLCKYDDPQGALSKLLQTETVAQYQSEFEKLMNRVTNISDDLLISFYVSGLKPNLQRELLVLKPTSLGDAFSLARVTEARLKDQGTSSVRGHKCLGKFLLLMADDEDECESPADEAVESDDISILNSLVGHGSPRSLQLWGTLGIGGGQCWAANGFNTWKRSTHDYAHQSMEFTVGNKTYTLKGEESLRMKQMSFNHMRALLESDEVYGIYEAYNLAEKGERPINTQVVVASEHPEITQLLAHFESLFQVRGFLGLAGYYRRFIKDYASIAVPLSCLLQKDGSCRSTAYAVYEGIGAVLLHQRRTTQLHFSRKIRIHVIQTPLQQKYIRKLIGFDFLIEYKPGVSNQVADALSCIYEEYEGIITSLMAMIRPLVGLINDLKQENETVEELRQLHRKLDREERLEGFRREQGLLLYRGRYYIGTESKLKDLLLSEFHNTPSAGHGGMKKMLATGELLQPLPTPVAVWEDVSMDFIIGLPASKGLTVILVVVNRFSKYAHFGTLPTSFNAPKPFNDRLHIKICDGRTSTFVYCLIRPGRLKVATVDEFWWNGMACCVTQHNLIAAKHRTEMKANQKRRDIEFTPGDRVLVKLQPYRQITVAKPLSNKLAKHHYRPFEVLERVGKVAYRLALPPTSKIHLVFHVSILKPFSGTGHELIEIGDVVLDQNRISRIRFLNHSASLPAAAKAINSDSIVEPVIAIGSATLKTIHLQVVGYSCLVVMLFLRLPKSKLVSTGSTMKSEFVALAAAGKEAEWLKNLLLEIPLCIKPIAPIPIRCDGAATLAKAYSQMYTGKSRHLGVMHSMIRELITNGVVSIEFVRSQKKLADHLTKGLARDLVIKSAEGIGLKHMYLHITLRMCLEPAEKEYEVVNFLMVNVFEKVLSRSMNKEKPPM